MCVAGLFVVKTTLQGLRYLSSQPYPMIDMWPSGTHCTMTFSWMGKSVCSCFLVAGRNLWRLILSWHILFIFLWFQKSTSVFFFFFVWCWKVVANPWKTPGFLASGGEEFNSGPVIRLDCSELLCNKVLIKYKRGRESFWHRHQKGAEKVPPLLVFSWMLYSY